MSETWKRIPTAPDYEASSAGRIRHHKTREIVEPWTDRDGYCRVSLDRAAPPRPVHRVVLGAFVGPPPAGRPEADHLNFERADNRVRNLERVSRQENVRRAYAAGRIHTHRDALGRFAPPSSRKQFF